MNHLYKITIPYDNGNFPYRYPIGNYELYISSGFPASPVKHQIINLLNKMATEDQDPDWCYFCKKLIQTINRVGDDYFPSLNSIHCTAVHYPLQIEYHDAYLKVERIRIFNLND